MACNQYTITFAVDALITFSDCSGVTQTLSGQTGQNFNICANQAPTLPSGVTLTDNGEAQYYFFSSCCGNYFFYLCFPVSSPPSSVFTFGSTYFQFEDGTSTKNKCVIYNASAVPPTEYYIPRVVAVNNDSIYTQNGDFCASCNGTLPSSYCLPSYFKLCCCPYEEPNIPSSCYFVYSTKSIPFSVGEVYLFELKTGEQFCAENITATTENFYSVTEYIAADFTTFTLYNDCLTCSETTPCPTPTPTPTPTNTPTPTVTPTVTPTPSSTTKFVNECDVLTIFEMGAECVILQPSTNDSNDGAASVKITGGTPPYIITWSNGNIASAIGNLTIGSYEATIVDSYGDFTAKTVCVLTGQTILPTPTPTPTATMPITGPQFCMNVKTEGPGVNLSFEQTFSVDSYLFGKPSWISGNGQYRIYWSTLASPNAWIMSGTSSPVLLVNLNPTNPPINLNWQAYGSIIQNLEVTEGACSPFPMLLSPLMIANPNIELYVVKNDTICGCEGSIIASADGGNPPYQYSVDNGITYKNVPIFQNLCSGVYTVSVLDNLGYGKTTQITINEPQQPTTYVVNLTKTSNIISQTSQSQTVTYDIQVVVDPPLPPTTTLTFDLVHTNTFGVSTTFSSATLVSNTVLYTNEVPVTPSNTSIDSSTSINTNDGCQDQTVFSTATTEFWYGLTYTSSDEIVINTTTSLTKNFNTACDSAFTDDNFYITNLTISGCNCCAVQNITL